MDQLKPICEGMGRREVTDLLGSELVRLRLERRNAYSYWAHEVEVYRCGESPMRIDFMHFEPADYHTCIHAGGIERGTFAVYEVKSCLADLKSGCGLNFVGDENWIVMPVELFERYKEARLGDRDLAAATARAGCLLYGQGRNGRPRFAEADRPSLARGRRLPASELLLDMMRALIANSGHSSIDHPVYQAPRPCRNGDDAPDEG